MLSTSSNKTISYSLVKNRHFPNNRSFCVCLTHDVDRIRKSYQYLTHFLKQFRLYHFLSIFMDNNPYWCFEEIMEIEEQHKVRSTFFFLNETKKFNLFQPYELPKVFGYYRLNDKQVIGVIKKLEKNGWEIGLHASYHSFDNRKLLAQEKKILEDILGHEVEGVRQHYLNLKIPLTWQIQKELGFNYDMSYGSNSEVGFQDDLIFPFRPFNDAFIVYPLAIMDFVLFEKSRKPKDAWEKCKKLVKFAKEKRTVLTVLWHSHVFNESEFPGYSEVYYNLIDYCLQEGAWIATAGEVTKFLNQNREEKWN